MAGWLLFLFGDVAFMFQSKINNNNNNQHRPRPCIPIRTQRSAFSKVLKGKEGYKGGNNKNNVFEPSYPQTHTQTLPEYDK